MSQETRYNSAVIYKLMSFKTDKIIIDGCCCSLARRKQDLKKLKNQVVLAFIEEYPDYYLSIIEEYPCKNKEFFNARISEVKKLNKKFHCETLLDLDNKKNIKRTESLSPQYYIKENFVTEESVIELQPKVVVNRPLPPPLPSVTMGRAIRPHSLTVRTTGL